MDTLSTQHQTLNTRFVAQYDQLSACIYNAIHRQPPYYFSNAVTNDMVQTIATNILHEAKILATASLNADEVVVDGSTIDVVSGGAELIYDIFTQAGLNSQCLENRSITKKISHPTGGLLGKTVVSATDSYPVLRIRLADAN